MVVEVLRCCGDGDGSFVLVGAKEGHHDIPPLTRTPSPVRSKCDRPGQMTEC